MYVKRLLNFLEAGESWSYPHPTLPHPPAFSIVVAEIVVERESLLRKYNNWVNDTQSQWKISHITSSFT